MRFASLGNDEDDDTMRVACGLMTAVAVVAADSMNSVVGAVNGE